MKKFVTPSCQRAGISPDWSLVQGADGNLYGTTVFGGTTNNGTVFKITPGGKLTTITVSVRKINVPAVPYPRH